MATATELDTSDRTTLERLNQEYIDALMLANVKWYEEHLADDFVCIESDGSVLNKGQFLINAAKVPDVADYKLEKVNVRIYGIVALVQATGLFTRKDGSRGLSRYTDIYVQTGQGWKAVRSLHKLPGVRGWTHRVFRKNSSVDSSRHKQMKSKSTFTWVRVVLIDRDGSCIQPGPVEDINT